MTGNLRRWIRFYCMKSKQSSFISLTRSIRLAVAHKQNSSSVIIASMHLKGLVMERKQVVMDWAKVKVNEKPC